MKKIWRRMRALLIFCALAVILAVMGGHVWAWAYSIETDPLKKEFTDDVDLSLVFSGETELVVKVDGEVSVNLSGTYGYGDTAKIEAPTIDGKRFSHWEADGSVISYQNELELTMNAHTTIGAVYSATAPDKIPAVGFTSITRSEGDSLQAIVFHAIADKGNAGDITEAGILYSTSATGEALVIDGAGVVQKTAGKLNVGSGSPSQQMPDSVRDKNDCWSLQIPITSADANTVYHARAYVKTGGDPVYGDVKDVKLSELSSGVSMIANLDGFDTEGKIGAALQTLQTQGINIPAAAVSKTPSANTLTYDGSAQALVAAGTTADGKMQYALGTDAATAPASGWSEAIPTATDAGTYYVWYKVVGDENHANGEAASVKVTIAKASVAKAKVTLKKTSYAYDGKAKEPGVKSVTLGGVTLKEGADYAVSYKDNKKVGTATATITGKGNYEGAAKATFSITPGKAKLKTVGKTASKGFSASWGKVAGAKSYELQWRKAGGKWKSATVKGTSKLVDGLKAGSLYQFRVRAVAGKAKGAWSNVSGRYLRSVRGVKATVKKSGAVAAAWQADPKANAGYVVVVRYEKGGKIVARAAVAKGKTKATVKGLKPGKKLWVEVRPTRASGGKSFSGVLHGTWAK